MNFDGKTIHINGRAEDTPLRSRREKIATDRFEQSVAKLLAIIFVSQNGEETRLCRLTGETLVDDVITTPIPDCHFEGRIMGKAVRIVLYRIPQRHREQAFTQEFRQRIPDPIFTTRIKQLVGQILGQPKLMISLTQQDRAAICSDPLVLALHLDGTVECRLK